ncbi:MAG TPA: hypothetical protein PLD59_03735 [Tepidisphaeraceae bacterium]|nr:hypothetical protein [Tepidisphaeraceae bacterium]
MTENNPQVQTRQQIHAAVASVLAAQPIVDMHTHVYPPTFGTPVANAAGAPDPTGLMLWGIDEMLTYHYLVAEVFRVVPATKLPHEQFWKMSKSAQADHIWKHLFVERSPVSEACRGVLTCLSKLGMSPADRSLASWRAWTAKQRPSDYIDKVMQLSNVSRITMTNPVFDDNERARWLRDPQVANDPRFSAVLRIDPILRDFPNASAKLASWGYQASPELSQRTIDETKRFLADWIDRQKAIYLAVSLPPDWRYPIAETGDPAARAGQVMLEKVVLPLCQERNLPFAMMIGSRLKVNPNLGDAGDMVGLSDVQSLTNLLRAFPGNRFFVTMLARENQHELAVAARKFGNLMVFGCWWFVNNPSLINEITRMRMELLGTSFIPQHSDARVLDQLIYKWDHTRTILAEVLTDKYADIAAAGWNVTPEEMQRDVRHLLAGNFEAHLKG